MHANAVKTEGESGRRALARNNFDFLRLVFSLGVVVFHAVALSAVAAFSATEAFLGLLAELSIQGFFIVSGALVYGSLQRSGSLGVYAEKRLRRLYPAYATIVLIPVLISGFLTGWAGSEAILHYLGANLIFLNFLAPELPGLFDTNRFTEVNGALWTLKIEVMFYIALPVLAWLLNVSGRLWWALLVAVYIAAEAWRHLMPLLLDHPFAPDIARQLPGQMAFFASGMLLWRTRDWAKMNVFVLLGVGAVLFAASFLHLGLSPLRPAGLAALVFALAYLPGLHIPAARFGDVSYGLYITHFPILQALVMLGLFASLGFGLAFGLALALVTAASVLLWHLVEKPALRRDSHYRKASETD
ncbi:MAG: acyltransferase [Henriciella sp.]